MKLTYNENMSTITIPKKLANQGDLIVIPRKEYEALLKLKKIKEFTPTSAQRRALLRAENNLKKGKALTCNELAERLGFTN